MNTTQVIKANNEIERLYINHLAGLRTSFEIEEVRYHQGFLNALDAIKETLK